VLSIKTANYYTIRVPGFKSNYFRYKNLLKSNLHHKISGRTKNNSPKTIRGELLNTYMIIIFSNFIFW